MPRKLSEYTTNQSGVIQKILDADVAERLVEFGFLPGTVFSVVSRAPFNGPLCVQIDNNRIALRLKEAAFVLVE
ncbi:MAG: FeoA family protein [Crocinitomicaceae bacterium]